MANKALIFDTSVFCCLLQVPGKETCGPEGDVWDHKRISNQIAREEKEGSTFVLPLATIIETGNHISQCKGDRHSLARELGKYIRDTAEGNTPWAAFVAQTNLWERDTLLSLADNWPDMATQGISLGDATIVDVADYYAQTGCTVEILTGDLGLKSHQPTPPLHKSIPRRRNR
ncbi:MAG: hypothetical protein H7833_13425 [Magnetococcus sp. DMHC-1]|nr:hypothetical protein [Magnetococcales bacterium]